MSCDPSAAPILAGAVGGHPPGDSGAMGGLGLAARLPWKLGWDLAGDREAQLLFLKEKNKPEQAQNHTESQDH